MRQDCKHVAVSHLKQSSSKDCERNRIRGNCPHLRRGVRQSLTFQRVQKNDEKHTLAIYSPPINCHYHPAIFLFQSLNN